MALLCQPQNTKIRILSIGLDHLPNFTVLEPLDFFIIFLSKIRAISTPMPITIH